MRVHLKKKRNKKFVNMYMSLRTWTTTYKEMLDGLLNGSEKLPAVIQDFKDYSTDKTVKLIITMDKVSRMDLLTQVEVKNFETCVSGQSVSFWGILHSLHFDCPLIRIS